MKVLLDSNILIYSAIVSQENLRIWLSKQTLFVSQITKLEVLGYHKISDQELSYFSKFIDLTTVLPVTEVTVDIAITLRQQKSMSLGDSLIAATAIQHGIAIATANHNDFKHLKNLQIVDPDII